MSARIRAVDHGRARRESARVSAEADLLAANIGTDRDPHSGYAAERAQHAVARRSHLGADVVMVYSYDAAEIVLRDQETFSARINGKWMRPLLGRTILEMDGPEHFKHRKLISHAFRARVVQSWEAELITPTVHECIDLFAVRGRAELVRELAWRMPVRVFAKVLGVPEMDHERWQRWAIDLERAALDRERARRAAREVEDYFAPLVARRRAHPSGDLISGLASAELDGERLPDDVIYGFIRLLIPAGAATTYRLLGTLSLALLSDAEQLDAVRADRALIAKAVDEALRWEAPVQFGARETTRDATLEGVEIEENTPVLVALGSANRDERRYEEPDRYDIRRNGPRPHVAFGDGVHRCLGEHLARVEAAVAFGALLDRLPDIRLDDDGSDPHVLGYAFRSPNRVPVVFGPT
jgi:cytochrome P450